MGISEDLQPQVLDHGYSFERILVPLDGSPTAERSLSFARALTERHGSRVVLARVIAPGAEEAEAVPAARAYMQQVAAALQYHGIDARTVVRVGTVPDRLLSIAAEEGISLIAMTTHGRETPEDRPYGVVGGEMLRSSALPILAVPSHAHAAKPEEHFRTILVVCSGEDGAEVATAADFALSFGADLAVLLRLVPTGTTGRMEAEHRVEAEEYLGRIARPFELKRIPTIQVIQDGDPVRTILAVAQDHQADVIAMSSGGSDTEGILRSATLPVLVSHSR